ncbi:MAG: bifunctional orotidine-5'-phosphate decarboxylase/orotate phosphoribosyltransferase [Microcoleaceae cyanobacterium]
MNFSDKLLAAIEHHHSLLYVNLDPEPEPDGCFNLKQSLEQWQDSLRSKLEKTKDHVCAYKLNLGLYQALGMTGIELLEWILKRIPSNLSTILDAKHSDLTSSNALAQLFFESWQVDACTLSAYCGQDQVVPFLLYPGKMVFVLGMTANPSAPQFQEYPSLQQPLYLEMVRMIQTWGTPNQIGLAVGLMIDGLVQMRQAAPERLILIEDSLLEANPSDTNSNSINSDHLGRILTAGLDENGTGLLLPIPHQFLVEDDPSAAIDQLRKTVNQIRQQVVEQNPVCQLWLSNVCFLGNQPHRDLILQLYDIGCIIFGDHVQSSGEVFPYYIDLRRIISIPQVFYQVVNAYAGVLQDLTFDRIAGIPYGSLPTATGLALQLERPMIFPRKEVKAHGTGRLVEGYYQSGEKIVVVDDVLITGNSVIKGAEKLKSVGLQVEDIVVLIDHGRDAMQRLEQSGYRGYAVLTLAEIAETLCQANRITAAEAELFQRT